MSEEIEAWKHSDSIVIEIQSQFEQLGTHWNVHI